MKSFVKFVLFALLIVLVCSQQNRRMQRNKRPNHQQQRHFHENPNAHTHQGQHQHQHQQQQQHHNMPHNNVQAANRLKQKAGLHTQQDEGVQQVVEEEAVVVVVEEEAVVVVVVEEEEAVLEVVVEEENFVIVGGEDSLPPALEEESVTLEIVVVEEENFAIVGGEDSLPPVLEEESVTLEVVIVEEEELVVVSVSGEEEEELGENEIPLDENKVYLYGYEDFDSGAWLEDYCVLNDRASPVNFELNQENGTCSEFYYADFVATDAQQSTWFENRDHSLVSVGNWDTLEVLIDGVEVKYGAIQFEFHSPSEHTINEQQFDLEMQVRHEILEDYEGNGFDRYAVVSYLFNESGTQTEGLKEFLEAFHPDQEFTCRAGFDCDSEEKKIYTNFSEFQELFSFDSYLYYQGSFTVPPCTPNVSWYVNPEPLGIFYKWLKEFKAYWPQNARFSNNVRNNGHFFDEWIGNNRPVQRSIVPQFIENCGTVFTVEEEIAPEQFENEGAAPSIQEPVVDVVVVEEEAVEALGEGEEWLVTEDEEEVVVVVVEEEEQTTGEVVVVVEEEQTTEEVVVAEEEVVVVAVVEEEAVQEVVEEETVQQVVVEEEQVVVADQGEEWV